MKTATQKKPVTTRATSPCRLVCGQNTEGNDLRPEILAIARLLARVAVDEYVESALGEIDKSQEKVNCT